MVRRSKEQIRRLIRGAMGEEKADLLVTNGKLINVYSGEILSGQEIAVLDGRICYVGPNAGHTRGDGTEVVDAGGLYIAPGFIDAHTHIGHFCRPYEYLQAYVPHGTTSLMASCDELATVFGFRGLQLFLDEVSRHPLRVFTLVSMVAPQDPELCSTRSFSQSEIAEALKDERVLGLGEIVSWLRLVQGDEELLERIAMAWEEGKIAHGHTAGARDARLCAVAGAGISSCHEPIRAEDAVERLRLGYWLMLREGSIRQDLEATLKPIVEQKLSTRRLLLVTDSMTPDDVMTKGHMDYVVRRGIELGLEPMRAIQAVTVNPAVYAGLDQEIGGIAPGRLADMIFFEDLAKPRVHQTMIGGGVVARDNDSLVASSAVNYPQGTMKSLDVNGNIARSLPEAFRIPCPLPSARIRVVRLVNHTITAEEIAEVYPESGFLQANVDEDLLKVAIFDRHTVPGKVTRGFLRGFGARIGAVGTTVNLDENTLLVVGGNDTDMALCTQALLAEGGGIAVADQGEIPERLAHPIGGLFSLDPWQQVGRNLLRLEALLRDRGSPFAKPLIPLFFLTFVTLPSLRITPRGLIGTKAREIKELFVRD